MAVKKTITYPDLDEKMVSEDWYFKLDRTDAVEMDFIHGNDVAGYFDRIVREKDTRELLRVYKEMIFRSVGKRVGNRLVKNEEILAEFKESGAYNQFFSELMESPDGGASFFMSIMPSDVQEKISEQENKTFSKEELLAMSDDEFNRVAGTDETKMSKEHLMIAFRRKTAKAA